MKRKFAALYDEPGRRWQIIAKDEKDDYWFVYVPDAGFQESAIEIAKRMNEDGI